MQKLASFDFLPLHSNKDGVVEPTADGDAVVAASLSGAYSDVVFIGHGFRNNENEAEDLYTKFAAGFDAHRSRTEFAATLRDRRYLFVGVYWPSKKFSEGDDNDGGSVQSAGDPESVEREQAIAELDAFLSDASPADGAAVRAAFHALDKQPDKLALQDAFVAAVLAVVPSSGDDRTEGLEQIRSKRGSELLNSLSTPILLPTTNDSEGGVMSVGDESGGVLMLGGFFKGVAGKMGQLMNMGTWYTMKARAGDVGAHTVATTVRRIAEGASRSAKTAPRVHLVGHSLGGRMMASAAKALAAEPMVPVTSVTLLEAAFSHYGFAANIDVSSTPGFFRDVIAKHVVKGPLVSTYSYQDTVVGKAYALSSRLAGDNTKAVGDKDDQYGGIGRNGAQQTAETQAHVLNNVGKGYSFVVGKVNNVDGSGGGITNHSDVTNDRVTYAFACSMAQT